MSREITHVPECTCLAVYEILPDETSRFVEWKMVCDACSGAVKHE